MCRPADGSPISDVTGQHAPAVDHSRPFDDADDESGDVVLAVGVETRHLGGLAADERTAVFTAGARNAGDHLLGDVGRESAGREIVQEEERLGALHEDVVDAVVDEIAADGVVPAGHEGDLELRADAVGARHQHRLPIALAVETEQPAERADLREHARRERRPRERLDAPDGFIAGVDVDAGGFVVAHSLSLGPVRQKSSLPMSVCISARRGELAGDSQ